MCCTRNRIEMKELTSTEIFSKLSPPKPSAYPAHRCQHRITIMGIQRGKIVRHFKIPKNSSFSGGDICTWARLEILHTSSSWSSVPLPLTSKSRKASIMCFLSASVSKSSISMLAWVKGIRERERGVMKKQVDSIHKELAWPSCIFFTCTLLKMCIAILYSQQGISLFLSSFLRLGRILLLAHGYDILILCLTMGIGFAPFSFLVNHQSPGTNEHCWARAGLSVTAGD